MKKIVSLICLAGILFSGIRVLADQKPSLLFSLGTPIKGEYSAVSIEISNANMIIPLTSSLTIIFSQGFRLGRDIPLQSIMVDGSNHPSYIEIKSANNIFLKIPPIKKDTIQIEFLLTAQIQNPIDQENVSISMILEESKLILFSDTIAISSPDNSVHAELPKKLRTIEQFFPEEFFLTMVSTQKSTIYYAIDSNEFFLYQEPIFIKNGSHQVLYYGKRSSGAMEPLQELRFQVDSVAPDVKIIDPPNKKLLNQKNQLLKVILKDYSPLHFYIMGQDIAVLPVIEGIMVEIPITLSPGENQLPYKAVDQVGYSKEGVITYFVDLTPPAVIVYSPKKGEVVCGSRVEISGKAELGSIISIFDQRVKTDSYGNFSFQIIPSTKGLNQLNILCVDPAGNENRINYNYYYFPGRLFEFLIGQNKSNIDGVQKDINPPPILDSQNGEVYVPLRFVSDALGFELIWSSKEGRALMIKNKNEIELRPNDSQVRIRSAARVEKIDLLYAPTLYKGSIMVPAEFLKKILGGEVIYDLSNARIFVNFCDKVGNP